MEDLLSVAKSILAESGDARAPVKVSRKTVQGWVDRLRGVVASISAIELTIKERKQLSDLAKACYADQERLAPGQPTRWTLTEQLQAEKRTLTDRLEQVNKVLAALEANPSFQELFDLISKYR